MLFSGIHESDLYTSVGVCLMLVLGVVMISSCIRNAVKIAWGQGTFF